MSNLTRPRDDDVVLAQFAEPGDGPRRPNRLTIAAVILAMAALVLGPVLTMGLPREASRWNQAAAEEARLNGDNSLANEKLDRALAWWPDNAAAILLRAQWKQQDGDYEGSLADYDRALQLAPNNPAAKLQRTVVLQHLGRHREAVDAWQELVREHARSNRSDRATMLNGLAYAQAVGNLELDEAIEHAEKALQLIQDDSSSRAPILDTRGYIHYLRGDLQAARRDLDEAVTEIEAQLAQATANRYYFDQRTYDQQLESLRHSVTVVVYHRSLILEALGESDAAEQDRQRVRQLGYTPDEQLF